MAAGRNLVLGGGAALLAASVACAADPLPSLGVDLHGTSVSGVSSGAYMAGQFHVAFSRDLLGAAIIAGGPYRCAEGKLSLGLYRCMRDIFGPPDASDLVQKAAAMAADGRIDPLSGLAGDRVYIFTGSRDEAVAASVVAQAAAFYRLAGLPDDAIAFVQDVPAGHAFITEQHGNPCLDPDPPYITDCDYDQSGLLLEHIHGPLNAPSAEPGGALIAFDQSEFLHAPTAHGMAETGYAYVPVSCGAGTTCRVHVAFHGCKQTASRVGDAFLTEAGYNRWADTNRLIVLYPQAHETLRNPNACWDWWGHDDPEYATRQGRQVAAVRAMVFRLAGSTPPEPFCRVHPGLNHRHWHAGRAHLCDGWMICASGSGEVLGPPLGWSALYESAPGDFSTAPCSTL